MHRVQVDFFGYTYEQCMVNYKILQQSFNKLGIERVCFAFPFVCLLGNTRTGGC